ncbi:MAG: PilZ domain-containing protein [Gammaproteobacteria bacterium]
MEKREHQRIQFGRHAEVSTSRCDQLAVDVLDYSMGGICLVSSVPLNLGEELHLHSIETLDGEIRPLLLKGEVRHIQKRLGEYSVGVCFT